MADASTTIKNHAAFSGDDVVGLVYEHCERLDPRWQRLLPLRRVFVVDQGPEDG